MLVMMCLTAEVLRGWSCHLCCQSLGALALFHAASLTATSREAWPVDLMAMGVTARLDLLDP